MDSRHAPHIAQLLMDNADAPRSIMAQPRVRGGLYALARRVSDELVSLGYLRWQDVPPHLVREVIRREYNRLRQPQ